MVIGTTDVAAATVPISARHPLRSLRLGFALMGLILFFFGGVSAWRSWETEKQHEFTYLSSLAQITSNSLDSYFARYQDLLSRLAAELRKHEIEKDVKGTQALLKQLVLANPELRRVSIIYPDGRILMTSDIELGGPVRLNNNASFQLSVTELRQGQMLSIGWTSVGTINGEWIMPLRGAVRGDNGELEYVLTATLPVAQQQNFWRGISLPTPSSSIGIMRDDAYVVSRYPMPKTMSYAETYGTSRSGALTQYLRANQFPASGVLVGYNSVAKADYLWAFQRLVHYPITVFVTTPTADVRAKWLTQIQFSMLLSMVLLIGGYVAYRLISSRQIAWEKEREQTEMELRLAATAMESQDGTMISDAAGVILRVNQAFAKITGYSAEEVVGRKTSLLKSGRHNTDFYAAMWESLCRNGSWTGEIWNRRKSGEIYPELLNITAVKGSAGEVTHYVGTFSDITSRKEAEDQVKQLAFYDPLTGLPNRRLLSDRLNQALASSARNAREGALLFIDLDNFKAVNDTQGHDKGDLLLREVAARLSSSIREADTVARIGGDEFVVVLVDLSQNAEEAAAQAEVVGEKVLTILGEPYLIADKAYRSTPSIGITLFGDQHRNIDDLMKQADIAMYQAKAAGRNTWRFFDPDLQAIIKSRVAMEQELLQGIKDHQFVLHYQPQVKEGHLTGAEALIRWQHPVRGLVAPGEFIPLAEETGLILDVGRWVLESACSQVAAWGNIPEAAHLTLAVNVSPRQFNQPDFVQQVLAMLERTGADPHKIELELTESMLVTNIDDIVAKMILLKSHGLRFSLDDFGTGFSSLSYLKQLPLNKLKIDQAFVREIVTNLNDAAIAQTIITMGKSLGIQVIAEGVETGEQADQLKEYGCNTYQGYLFSRPVPIHEFAAFLITTNQP